MRVNRELPRSYLALLTVALVVGAVGVGCGPSGVSGTNVTRSTANGGGNTTGGSGSGGTSTAGGGAGNATGGSGGASGDASGTGMTGTGAASGSGDAGNGSGSTATTTSPATTAPAGNPDGHCPVPLQAAAEDTSHPTTVVGDGTAASCTADAFETAVHGGGVITFNCGPDPVTITLAHEVQIINDSGPNRLGDTVIDGGGKVTLSGGGATRILYQDGCDPDLHFITDHCQDYEHPRLVVQNLTFADGRALEPDLGGGALYVRSGILKVVNSVFVNNRIASTGPDVAGGAIYAFQQAGPVYIVSSTFGGAAGTGNVGSNGGAIGSIGVSYTILNSTMTYNSAVGSGMNPAQPGTPGGGSGGAIYNDGNTYALQICGTKISDNSANELAGAVFFVSNDRTGTVKIDQSVFEANSGNDVQNLPGFFVLAKDPPAITNTIIE